MRGRIAAIILIVGVLAAVFPTAPAAAAERRPSVYLLGDSVMHGAPDAIREQLPGWQTHINTFVGRFLHHGLATLRDERHLIQDVAVLHLGNNYLGNADALAQQIDEAMRILEGVDEVIWLNIQNHSNQRDEVNVELAKAAGRWPHLVIADWRLAAFANPGSTWSDGTHLTPSGRQVYSSLIARHLNEWLSPPTSCHPPDVPPAHPSPASARGYWLLDASGSVHAYGLAHHGDLRSRGVPARPVAMAATSHADGYWVLDAVGGVHAFGGAGYHGSLAGTALNEPPRQIVAAAGGGYWIVAADGGVFSFGGAPFHGSTGGTRLNAPIVSLTANPDGAGYWLVAADGGVFSFGGAPFHGSTGDTAVNAAVTSLAASPAGGYWLYALDGGVFAYRTPFHGSVPGLGYCQPPRAWQLRGTRTGAGYWIVTRYGEIFTFGDAAYHGGSPDLPPGVRVLDMVVG